MKVKLGIKEFAPGKFSWMVNICEWGTDDFNYIDELKAAKARWDNWKPRAELEMIEI